MIFDEDFEIELVTADDETLYPSQPEKDAAPEGIYSDWDGWVKSGYQDWRKFIQVKPGETPLVWKINRLPYTAMERVVSMQARRADQAGELKVLLSPDITPEVQARLVEVQAQRADVSREHWATPYFEAWRYAVQGWDGIFLKDGNPLTPNFETGRDGERCLAGPMAAKLASKAFASVIACGRIVIAISGMTEQRKNS